MCELPGHAAFPAKPAKARRRSVMSLALGAAAYTVVLLLLLILLLLILLLTA